MARMQSGDIRKNGFSPQAFDASSFRNNFQQTDPFDTVDPVVLNFPRLCQQITIIWQQ